MRGRSAELDNRTQEPAAPRLGVSFATRIWVGRSGHAEAQEHTHLLTDVAETRASVSSIDMQSEDRVGFLQQPSLYECLLPQRSDKWLVDPPCVYRRDDTQLSRRHRGSASKRDLSAFIPTAEPHGGVELGANQACWTSSSAV